MLQGSIVLLGATLSLQQVARVGGSSLPVMLGSLAVALLGAWGLGRLLGVLGDAQLLIAVGTGIWRQAGTGAGARSSGLRTVPWSKVVPRFLVGFVVASALTTVGVVPASWHAGLTFAGTFLISTALAGIGLSMRPADLRRAGVRPLLLGAGFWVLVGASSLGLQGLTGRL